MLTELGTTLIDKGLLTDGIVSWGIRRICAERIREEEVAARIGFEKYLEGRTADLNNSQIAILTEKANEQHYEVPSEFYFKCLGPRLKYSSCYYPKGNESLAQAEEEMLKLYEERAQIVDGMKILELGCGWGSLTLWLAQRFPNSLVTGVSNSHGQREFIENRAREWGLNNVRIITHDINTLEMSEQFDRVVSVEMFEHMRNYRGLFEKISTWMRADAKMFVHVFCHKQFCYPYETEGASNWMGRYFFSGGYMPSVDLFYKFNEHLRINQRWLVDGTHYEKTSRDWLQNLDQAKAEVLPILAKAYGKDNANMWFQRWRVFFLSCAELFGYKEGKEWMLAHYLFEKVK
jgi:cyclopropane-fatty-acyl-phospholipid synthase